MATFGWRRCQAVVGPGLVARLWFGFGPGVSGFFLKFLFPSKIITDKRAAKRRAREGRVPLPLRAASRRSLVVLSSSAAPPPRAGLRPNVCVAFSNLGREADAPGNLHPQKENRGSEICGIHHNFLKKRVQKNFFLRS